MKGRILTSIFHYRVWVLTVYTTSEVNTSLILTPAIPQATQPQMQTYQRYQDGVFAGWADPVSLIIIMHEADDGETQILTKSPGLCSSAEKW